MVLYHFGCKDNIKGIVTLTYLFGKGDYHWYQCPTCGVIITRDGEKL
jgi:predicted RNA-binding Zn-ribbon protein involved in translation (DUF1610 family)